MGRGLLVGMGLVLVGGLVTPAVTPVGVDSVSAAVPRAAMPFDFDGDGYADLAVAIPWEDIRGTRDAGAVQVLYGSASGVTARDQVWHQGSKGIKDKLEKRDRFGGAGPEPGDALASGDFDADGYADLAIGVPYEDVGSIRDAGIVQVLYGSAKGLTARDQVWHRGKPGVPGSNGRGGGFGHAVAAGDFDADGYADLAIGSGEGVLVLRGGLHGLTSSGCQFLRPGRGGIPSQPASGGFGSRLAVGDVNGDGHDDLAVAAFHQGAEGTSSALHMLLGSEGGLTSVGTQYVTAVDLGMWPLSIFTLAFGDLNSDGRSDLVLASTSTAVLYGHADGLHPAVLPAAADVAPGVDALWPFGGGDEDLGAPAAVGDLTGDGHPDLAVVDQVILGTATGLGPGGTSSLDLKAFPSDVCRICEWGDIAVLPFSGGSHAWLAASHYVPPPGMPAGAGAVSVMRGLSNTEPGPATVWSQDSPGIKDAAEVGDGFGMGIGG